MVADAVEFEDARCPFCREGVLQDAVTGATEDCKACDGGKVRVPTTPYRAYLAAPFVNRKKVKAFEKRLAQEAKVGCTSRWLDVEGDAALDKALSEPLNPAHARLARSRALVDVTDLYTADVFVQFPVRGKGAGHNVELGLALAAKKPVVIVGAPTSVFAYLDDCFHVADDDEAIARLAQMRTVTLGRSR